LATVSISITRVNAPPRSNPDSVTTGEDTPITINLLANDSDPDGFIDPSSVQVIQPDNGTASNNFNGTVTYAPNPNFSGIDTFIYTVADTARALSTAATVTVAVTATNDAPTANSDSSSISSTNLSTTINVVANDTDPDSPGNIDSASVETTQGSNGSVTNNGNGTVTYTQTTTGLFGQPQPNSFTYTVADAAGARSNPAMVTISVGASFTAASAC
jgi:large repetitive protein